MNATDKTLKKNIDEFIGKEISLREDYIRKAVGLI